MTNRSIIAKATFALSFALAGLSIATPVLAADEMPTAEISLAGLDLNSPAGRQKLERRIHVAASKVCPSTGSRGLSETSAQQTCFTKAVAQAREQIAQRHGPAAGEFAALSPAVSR